MIKTCTRGKWNYGSSHQLGTNDWVISVFTPHYPKSMIGPTKYQNGDMNGIIVHSSEEVTRIGLEKGYTQPYFRNLTEFVMSRSARKRGIQSPCRWYNDRREWEAKERIHTKNQTDANIMHHTMDSD